MVNMTDITRNIPKNSSLYNCLTEVKLDKFYDNFVSKRITTCEKLATISIVDFEHYGITSMNDRLRLFQLIQIIKSVAFKNQNPGFKEQTDFNKNKIKKVVSDDQLVSTHKSKSHTKLPWDGHNDLKMDSIQQLEEETSKLLQDEKMRRPLSSTSEGMLNYQEPSADAKKRLNLFKSYKDNESKQKMQNSNSPVEITDENTSRNAKIPNKQYEDGAFSSYPKSSKEDRVNENEKPLMVKETFHNGGYNYGVPHQKFPSRNIPQVTKGIGSGKASPDKVKVCVRKRPRNAREINSNDPDVVVIKSKNTVILQEQKTALNLTRYIHQHVMTFDEVFDETNTNVDVYKSTIKPLVSFVLKRGTAICFTFGQTGAGKTHTLIGDKSHPGLYQLAGRDLFESIQISGDANVWVSFYEIYCGQLFDLLNNRKKLVLMEKHNKQVCVTGLMETHATDLRSLIHIINFGRIHRSKGSSGVNPVSSRSHAVLQLDVRSTETNKRIGRLTFIDLAGSERASDAMMCNKQTRYEGAEINQSLLALKECIRSLDQEQSYTPYRQSKLTHILRESFSGNCQTVMIANISPTLSACENTLNTLRYADRVQELKKASQQKMKSNPKKFKDLENSFPPNSNPSPPPPSKPMLDQGSKSRNDSPSLSTTIIRSPLFLFHLGNASSMSNTEIESPSNVSSADIKYISTPSKTVSSTFSNDHPPKFSQNVMKENEKGPNLYPDMIERFRNEICNDHLEKERKLSRKEVVAENQTPSRKGTKLRNPCDNRAFMCPQSDKSLTVERNCRSQPSRSGSSQNYKYEKLVPERETKLIANFFGTNPQIFLKKLQGYRIKDHKDSQTVFLLRSSHMAKPKSPHDKNRRKSPKLSDSKTDIRKKHKVDSKERGSSLPLNSQKKPSVDKSNELPQKPSDQENFAHQPDNEPENEESSEITSSDASRKFYQDAFMSLPAKSDETSNNRDFQVDSSLNASNSIVDGQNAIGPSSPINYVLNSESLLVNAHEKHLDSVTQLCREEIDLLMKLRTGQMPFHNYVSKIRGIMATRKQMSDALINHIGQFESFNNSLS